MKLRPEQLSDQTIRNLPNQFIHSDNKKRFHFFSTSNSYNLTIERMRNFDSHSHPVVRWMFLAECYAATKHTKLGDEILHLFNHSFGDVSQKPTAMQNKVKHYFSQEEFVAKRLKEGSILKRDG